MPLHLVAAVSAMLDTNAFDEIYDRRLANKLRLAVNTGKIKFFITHIQRDEIAKMPDTKRDKRTYSQNAITTIPVEIIVISAGVFSASKPTKHGFEGSRFGWFRFNSEEDSRLLDSLKSKNSKNPMGNFADLLIAFTAIKEKMNYLVTDNDQDFARAVEKMNTQLRGNTAMIDIDALLNVLSKLKK